MKDVAADAFAVVSPRNEIDVRTVSETPRAAMANAIHLYLTPVTSDWSDDSISTAFSELRRRGVRLCRVSVQLQEQVQ